MRRLAIIGSMQGRCGDGIDQPTAFGYLAEALNDLGEHARQYQVPLIYEPLNRYETNMVNTVADGVRFLRSLSTKQRGPAGRPVPHEHRGGEYCRRFAAGRDTSAMSISWIPTGDPPAWAISTIRPSSAALAEIGYDGFASAEALPYPDPDAAARQTIQAFRQFCRAGWPVNAGRSTSWRHCECSDTCSFIPRSMRSLAGPAIMPRS